MLKNIWYPVFFFLSAVLLSACDAGVKVGYFDDDKVNALSGGQKFRKLYNEQDFAELYELGAPVMKSAVTREQFVASARLSAAQFGKYKSSKLIASSCFPNEVRLVYQSEYEKAKVTEFMIWSIPNNTAQLVMYQIALGHSEFDKESQVGCPI